MSPKHVLSLTPNPTIDKSTSIEHVAPEIKLRCDKPSYEPGGGGINVGRVLNRFDVKVQLLQPTGGPHDRFLEKLLSEEGLNYDSVSIEGITRESFVVQETSSKQQYRFSEAGPELTKREWQSVLTRIEESIEKETCYVIGSGSLPPGVNKNEYATISQVAREKNARFILDTSGEFLQSGLEGKPFLIKPNLRELQQIVGHEIKNDDGIIQASRKLVENGRTENVVVSLGAGGAILVGGAQVHLYRAPTVQINSKVGAGDSMVGGIVYGLLETDCVPEAVRYGVAAGSAAVKTPGTELCHPEDVRALFDRVKIKKSDEEE